SRVAPTQATTGTYPRFIKSDSNCGRPFSTGAPTRPRSTSSPATVLIGADRFIVATVASAPVRPTGFAPARRTAATSRVLIAPASTETTTFSVGSQVPAAPSP